MNGYLRGWNRFWVWMVLLCMGQAMAGPALWPPGDTLKLMVWLKSGEEYLGESVICFNGSVRLHKPQHILVNSIAYGPIGVKDVVDALRIAPDEPPCAEVENLERINGLLLLSQGDLLHIVWEADLPGYSFYLVQSLPGLSDCGVLPDLPPLNVGPDLIVPGDLGAGESLRLVRRTGPGVFPAELGIFISTGCVD